MSSQGNRRICDDTGKRFYGRTFNCQMNDRNFIPLSLKRVYSIGSVRINAFAQKLCEDCVLRRIGEKCRQSVGHGDGSDVL